MTHTSTTDKALFTSIQITPLPTKVPTPSPKDEQDLIAILEAL